MIQLLISFFLTLPAQAQTSLRIFENDSYKDVKLIEYQKTHFSADCMKGGKLSCKAWTAFEGKPVERKKSEIPLAGNPAAQYCWDLKAKNRILKDSANRQYDYCVFEDGSMVDAWKLYDKHFPQDH